MDITFFIFLSLISLFFMIYGWQTSGINFMFLILSSAIFTILAFSSYEITWSYPVIQNSTATAFVITESSMEFARFYGLLAAIMFPYDARKSRNLAEENLNYDFSPILKRLGGLLKK